MGVTRTSGIGAPGATTLWRPRYGGVNALQLRTNGGATLSRQREQSPTRLSAPTGNGCVAAVKLNGSRGHRPLLDGMHRLAGLAVEQEQEPVGAQRRQRRPPLAVHRGVVQQGRDGDVGVPQVVADHLVVPAQGAGVHVQSQDGRRVQVVAATRLAAEHRHGVAGDEVDEPEVGIRVPDVPDAGAPPCSQTWPHSPACGHVSCPGSPGPGIV